jgi:hypothetical protein
MKILDITPITNTAQFPPKKGTWQFLQDAHKETTAATIIALIGPGYNPSTVYILYGPTVNSWITPNFSGVAGAAFYNGEVFQIDAASFTITGSNVPVFSINTTQYTTNADPVTFTDATTKNVHNIRKMLIAQGASGSGIADYTSAYFLSFVIPAQVNLTGAGVTGSYPNYTIAGPSGLNPAIYSGSVNVGNIATGGSDITVTFPNLGTANYIVLGSMISNGTAELDGTVLWNIRSRTATSFIVHFREDAAVTQNVAFEYILFAK